MLTKPLQLGRFVKDLEDMKSLPDDHPVFQGLGDRSRLRFRAARLLEALKANNVISKNLAADRPEA